MRPVNAHIGNLNIHGTELSGDLLDETGPFGKGGVAVVAEAFEGHHRPEGRAIVEVMTASAAEAVTFNVH